MKHALFCILVAVVAVVAAGPAAAQNQVSLDQVFARIDEVARSFRTLEADIERTKVTVLINDRFTELGKVYYARRGDEARVKLDIAKPAAQHVLIDEGKVRLFYPKLKQVQEYSLGENRNVTEFFLIGFGQNSTEIRKAYEVTLAGEETIDGKRVSVLELKPKSARVQANLSAIRLWIEHERGIAVQIQVTEPSRDYSVWKYSNIRLNGRVPDSIFKLDLPKDVQIIKG